jgi:hypothetical protein
VLGVLGVSSLLHAAAEIAAASIAVQISLLVMAV